MPPAARPLARLMVGWALLADIVPLYPLYALLFSDAGLSDARISGLFALWSVVGILAEVPSGALADRFSRRGALVAAGVLQAAGYVGWLLLPEFAGFAGGFVLWGLGGALISGAQEALLYDGLAAVGAEDEYARVQGRVSAAELIAQVPGAAAAVVLFGLGGYHLVGWVSVGTCLAAALVASRLPEPRRRPDPDEPGYVAVLRAGVGAAVARPGLRTVVLAAALLGGVDAFEEYDGLLADAWGVATTAVPLAVTGISLCGAAGALLGGRAVRLSGPALAGLLGLGVVALGVAGVVAHPLGLLGVAAFYGLYRVVLIVVDARLQERVEGTARATVTSVAGLGVEIAGLALFGTWALGGLPLVAALLAVLTVALPWLLRIRRGSASPGGGRPGDDIAMQRVS